ncbi:MAG: hypothetical protein Q9227_009245 [Pyrenula ochraceoflavens]
MDVEFILLNKVDAISLRRPKGDKRIRIARPEQHFSFALINSQISLRKILSMSQVNPSHPSVVAFMSEAAKALGGVPLPAPKDVFQFAPGNAKVSNDLLNLALRGVKTGTTSWPLPNPRHWDVGDLSVILDGDCKPTALMRTTNFRECKFEDVTVEFVESEGEGGYEGYREGHLNFYKRDGSRFQQGGEEFGEESVVLCETFEILYPPKVGA